MFRKAFRKHGANHLSTYLTTYKQGDYVDIVADPGVQKGMPFKYYQGKTGRVFNVSRTALGIEVLKPVKQRYIAKRFHLRVEHVRKSRCQDEFKKFIKRRDAERREAKKAGTVLIAEKRKPKAPEEAKIVSLANMELLRPIKYEFMV